MRLLRWFEFRAGWAAALGFALLAVIVVQAVTGAAMTLYYVASPDHAWDSVRFISNEATLGWLVRGLHHYGASFVVVITALHLLHAIVTGAYPRPRQFAWLSGVALLLVVLGLGLTGYLLPWDQRAYWATVISINLSSLAPGAGSFVAAALRGGETIGALTLSRWYALHVVFLPALLFGIVVLHVVLSRRAARTAANQTVVCDTAQPIRIGTLTILALAALVIAARHGAPALGPPADPSDATYVPRPEWYFLSLFQLLKYFPGRLEVIGAIVIPAAAIGWLVLLPWLDRRRRDATGPGRVVLGTLAIGLAGVVVLTLLGARDKPSTAGDQWSMREIGGRTFAQKSNCTRCHAEGGMADPIEGVRSSRGPEWIGGHVADPEMIAPGLREPPTTISEREVAAIVAYVNRAGRQPYPGFAAQTETAAVVWARYCVGCHVIDGDGGKDGPNLTHAGAKHDAATLRKWITDPESVDANAEMPSFGRRLSPAELDAISAYLAARK